MKKVIYLLSILIFIQINNVKGERFTQFLSRQGFTQNSAAAICQDSRGFIWIGTPNGLFKYDGYDFKIYRTEVGNIHSLIYNVISGIHEDPEGRIWINTPRGISIYNHETDQFNSIDRWPLRDCRDISFEFDGKVIISTDYGLFESNNVLIDSLLFKEIYFEDVKLEKSFRFISIYKNKSGTWFLGTSSGIIRWKPDNTSSEPFKNGKFDWFKDYDSIPGSNSVVSMLEDANGDLFIGTFKGLFRLTRDQIKRVVDSKVDCIKDERIRALALDSFGNIWIGTTKSGLIKYDGKSYKKFVNNIYDPNSLGSNHINVLLEDHSGVLWIGTARGGLNKLDLNEKPIKHFYYDHFTQNSLSSSMINCIYEDFSENVWVGTFDGGLNLILHPDSQAVFKRFTEFNSSSIYDITQDDQENYYCSVSDKGLFRFTYNNGIKNLEKINISDESGTVYNNFSVIFIDHDGIIWLGADGITPGLIRFDPDAKEVEDRMYFFKEGIGQQQNVPIMRVADIYEDSKGDLWLGTSSYGLFRVRMNTETRMPYQIRNIGFVPFAKAGLTNDRVFSILEDKDNSIWLGVFGGGLIKINRPIDEMNLNLEYLSVKDGLADDGVYGILKDKKNNFWISTNNGISNLDFERNTFINYDVNDGLQENNFRRKAYHKGRSNKFYFGGINGVNVFNPMDLKQNISKPKVVFTDLKIFNKKVQPGEKRRGRIILEKSIGTTSDLVLHSKDNSFSLEFSALHFSTPEKNQYKYILEGFDSDWNYAKSNRRFASYSNLNAGNYLFKVMAANSDGVWNEIPTVLNIEILPPWWQTFWAYIIYLLIVTGALVLFRRYVLIKNAFEHEIELEKMEKSKMAELNRAKLEFFTNITHEFKTPLTLIVGPATDLINTADQLPRKIKDNIDLINNNANRMLRLINQLIEFRRMEAGHFEVKKENIEMVSFLSELIKTVGAIGQSRNINFSVQFDTDRLELFQDKDKLEKIFYNLLSNAIKYTPDFGLVSVDLKIENSKNIKDSNKDIFWSVTHPMKRYVEISVANSGSGIKSEYLPYIFDRFYGDKDQSALKDKNIFKSSGIGLALIKRLVDLHQGDLGVCSRENETKFIVRLPLLDNTKMGENEAIYDFVMDNQELSKEETIEKTNNDDDKKPIVLVVDDHAEIRKYISNTFSETYHIMEAVNGQDAYNMVLRTIPDLIISDVMMPVMDGLTFCNKIKTNEVTNHIPIIMLTAKTGEENKIDGLEVGADSYIAKPFNMQHLKIRMEKLLELRKLLRVKYINGFQYAEMDSSGMKQHELKFIKNIEEVIEKNLMNEAFSVEDLGSELAFSRMQLYRKLKALTGYSPNEYIRNYRLKKASLMLKEGELNVTEVLYQIGFTNKSYFTKCFKEMFDMTPKEYSKKYNENR